MKTTKILLALALIYSLAVPTAPAQLTGIGAAGAVSGKVTAQAAVQRSKIRVISSGKVLYYKDDVATNPKGRMQILLLDETVFTVGPDTELTLDEFVYDPFTETGKVSASLAKGAIKFVSGRIAAKTPENMKIKTPVGTIGVRGTAGSAWTDGKAVMVGNRGPGPNNNAKSKPGAVTLTGTKPDPRTGKPVSVEARRVGSIAEIKTPGADPSVRLGTPADWAKMTPTQKAKGNNKDDGPGGKAKASKTSKQDMAKAEGDLKDVNGSNTLAKAINNAANNANNDVAEGGGITDFTELLAIQSGTAMFQQSGGYTCGGACSGSGTWDINIDILFASRQVSGSVGFLTGPLSGSASTSPAYDYTGKSGPAQFTPTWSPTDFSGTKITIKNTAAGVAQQMQVDLQYSNSSSETASGQIIANRQ